mgnify:CR=1 FL=1
MPYVRRNDFKNGLTVEIDSAPYKVSRAIRGNE